jgi:hypothetical protein
VERATIRVDKFGRSAGFTIWQFHLVNLAGDILATSDQFKSGNNHPSRNPVVLDAWDTFGRRLRADGWVMVGQPANHGTWWEVPLVRGDRTDVESEILRLRGGPAWGGPAIPSRSGPGCAIWSMWGITLLVIIGLFALCVLLVLTSEIRFGPA